MKLLKTDDNVGKFLAVDGSYVLIDKISKEDLLRLVNKTLNSDEIEMDPYDADVIKNQAHQVIYKSIHQKLTDLRSRRKEFTDEAARLFLAEYEKYKE